MTCPRRLRRSSKANASPSASVSHAPASRGVATKGANGTPEIIGSHLLLAVGRRPNNDDLGLDAAGVRRDEYGYVAVDDQLRTSMPGIWALPTYVRPTASSVMRWNSTWNRTGPSAVWWTRAISSRITRMVASGVLNHAMKAA